MKSLNTNNFLTTHRIIKKYNLKKKSLMMNLNNYLNFLLQKLS